MKKPLTSSSSGLSTSRPYVKVLRPFRSAPTTCFLCGTNGVRCYWVTQDASVNLDTMKMVFFSGSTGNCHRGCEVCLREMGLLW